MSKQSRRPVTIVVPVFNSEQWLDKCLESLVEQTLQDIEIIVVDDGSTDESIDIAREFQEKYSNKMRILSKPNGGLSDARNYGVAHASGDYVGFVDSDDFVELDMFGSLYSEAVETGAEISIGGFYHYALDGRVSEQGYTPVQARVFDGLDFLHAHNVMVVWNKLYRLDLIRDIKFPKTWFEDVAWTPVVMSRARRVCQVRRPFYHYVRRPDSIASSHADPRTLQGIKALEFARRNVEARAVNHVNYMAARRLLFEARVRRCYADHYLNHLSAMSPDLVSNNLLLDDPKLYRRLRPYIKRPAYRIPKVAFYTDNPSGALDAPHPDVVRSWEDNLVFGDGRVEPASNRVELCSSAAANAGLELSMFSNPLVKDLICRLLLIHEIGGISVAGNVHASGFFAPHLLNSFVVGFGPSDELSMAVVAAEPGSAILSRLFEELAEMDGESLELLTVSEVAAVLALVLRELAGFSADGATQSLTGGVTVLGKSVLWGRFDDRAVAQVLTAPGASSDSPNGGGEPPYVAELRERSLRYQKRLRVAQRNLAKKEKELATLRSKPRWRIARRLPKFIDTAWILQRFFAQRAVRARLAGKAELRVRARYSEFLDDEPILPNRFLFESFYGRGPTSSPRAIFEELRSNPVYRGHDYQYVWVVDSPDAVARFRQELGSESISFVVRDSSDYYRELSRCKYLINDVTFFFDFVKKPGQVYLNTWHSLTVKTLGYDIPGRPLDQKNVVRNLLAADFIVAANDFMKSEIFERGHRLSGLFRGRYLSVGHPRNDLTIKGSRSEAVAKLVSAGLDVDPARPVVVYAPTWRGRSVQRPTDDVELYSSVLESLSKQLDANVLLRPHQASYRMCEDILGASRVVPATIDANMMFPCVDVLVTDYSSIYFDFAVLGRPIVFFTPDSEEYERERGTYFKESELPGAVCKSLDALNAATSEALGASRTDGAMNEKSRKLKAWACPQDDGGASARVLAALLENGSVSHQDANSSKSAPPCTRLIIHPGSLSSDNSLGKLWTITDLIRSEYQCVDVSVIVNDRRSSRQSRRVSLLLDSGVRVLGRSPHMVLSRREMLVYRRGLSQVAERGGGLLSHVFEREWRRCVGDAEFDAGFLFGSATPFYRSLMASSRVPTLFIEQVSSDGQGSADGAPWSWPRPTEQRRLWLQPGRELRTATSEFLGARCTCT